MNQLNLFQALSNRRRLCAVIAFTVFGAIVAFSSGCERERAKARLVDALNARRVVVTNGQAAVLRVQEGYVAVVPRQVRHNEIRYVAYFSVGDAFSRNSTQVAEGVLQSLGPVDIQGVRVFVGYGGLNATEVMLDLDDVRTGLALASTNDLNLVAIGQLRFEYNRSINPSDVAKSVGVLR